MEIDQRGRGESIDAGGGGGHGAGEDGSNQQAGQTRRQLGDDEIRKYLIRLGDTAGSQGVTMNLVKGKKDQAADIEYNENWYQQPELEP